MDNPQTQSRQADPELKQRLADLYAHMAKRLRIQQIPKITFTQNAANAKKPFGLTAFYDQQNRSIKVYITDRHPTDILRSFAHELIHHWQNEHGALPSEQPTGGHEHYAQKSPVLRQREMEAYLLGNILFRDWQDEKRYGPLNEGRQPIQDSTKKAIKELLASVIIKTTESKQPMTETISQQQLKTFIKERIMEMGRGRKKWGSVDPKDMGQEDINNWNEFHPDRPVMTIGDLVKAKAKYADESGWGKSKSKSERGWDKFFSTDSPAGDDRAGGSEDKENQRHITYSQWLKKFARIKQKQDKRADKYYQIGFTPSLQGPSHYCWYWDAAKKELVMAFGGSHLQNFGKDGPYKSFRGRYDIGTKELSVTVPEFGAIKLTGKLEDDAPPGMLDALNKKFSHPKMYYFPFIV